METLPEDASQGSQPRMIEEAGRVDMETYSRAQIRYTNLEKDNKLSGESESCSKFGHLKN